MSAAKWKIALLLLLAGGAFLVVLTQPKKKVEPPQIAEALLQELALRDGRMHRTNESAPFTGFAIERYPDQILKSRSSLAAGLLEGVSEGWHTNGQLQVREFFKGGISHGPRTKWHEDGKLMSETMIENGKHHGTFRRWHENGQLAESVEMRAGEPHGVSLAHYPSGFLKARAVLENGKVIKQATWQDGEKRDSEGEQSP